MDKALVKGLEVLEVRANGYAINRGEWRKRVHGFAGHAAEELIERFRAAGVPCAPINRYSQALADGQVQHMQRVREVTLPGGAAPAASGE